MWGHQWLGRYGNTIKATDGSLTSTLAYQVTTTVQGAPYQLLCDPADNGGFLESGTCVLPDATVGQPYQGHLVTSHQAGGTLSVVAGALPPGLSLPATFTGSVLVAGGLVGLVSNPQTTATAMLYDPDTNTWTGTGNMTTGRENQIATLLPDGQVLMAGGTLFDHPSVGHPGLLEFLASAELYTP